MLMRTLANQVRWHQHVIGYRPGKPTGGTGSTAWRLLRDYLRFIRLARSGQHDLVHLNPSFIKKALARDLMFVALAQWLSPLPQLVFIHGWDWSVFERVQSSRWRRWLVGRLLARADRVLVLSRGFKQALQTLGVSDHRIEVVTTMFSAADLGGEPPDPRQLVRPIRLLFLSRVVREKGILESIEAVALLRDRGLDVELAVAGDGPDLAAARAKAVAADLVDQIHFLGYVRGPAKARALREAQIYLLPSAREGCPVAMLEAMACGLPVVATAVGGIPEVMADGTNGQLIEQVDAECIAQAVERLTADPGRWLAISQANRHKAWQLYESRPVSDQMLSIYRETQGAS